MNTPERQEVAIYLETGSVESRLRVSQASGFRDVPLGVGTAEVAALFRRDPPLEADLEAAIDLIEEAVMPLAKHMTGKVLIAGNEVTRAVVNQSTGAGETRTEAASIEAVEGLFTLLASASRRGAWPREMSLTPDHSAALIILREFMHHAGVAAISTVPGN